MIINQGGGDETIMSEQTYMQSYKYKIYPTEDQKIVIVNLIDLRRYVYNWGIAMEEKKYQEKKDGKSKYGFYSYYDLNRLYGVFRKQPGNEFLQKLPLSTARLALRDVANAYLSYFKNPKQGYPKFKSKKTAPKMFKTRSDRFYIDGGKVRFEGLYCSPDRKSSNAVLDMVDLKFDPGLSKNQKIKYISPSISIDALGNYWVSFTIEQPKSIIKTSKTEALGIDMGIRQTLALSTGEIFIRPNDKIERLNRKLARLQRHYSHDITRRQKEAERTKTKYDDIPISKRSQKRLNSIRKTLVRITNIKHAWYHNTIKEIVTRNPEAIVIENLRVREMQQKRSNQVLRNALFHSDFYTMRRIFEDKCNRYGVNLILAPTNYPSSQICSNCGYVNPHKDHGCHVFKCPECGTRLDRDINAALNLVRLAS